jgi:hypothetical protein
MLNPEAGRHNEGKENREQRRRQPTNNHPMVIQIE